MTVAQLPIAAILDNLAAGRTPEHLIGDHPALTPETVRAAIAYAADLAR